MITPQIVGERPADATLELSVGELNLSVRPRKCLKKFGVNTLGELVQLSAKDMLECQNFGITSLKEVREKLAEYGLKLRGE